ncbi:hypothetical protein ABK040_003209 [Willaertia magna]
MSSQQNKQINERNHIFKYKCTSCKCNTKCYSKFYKSTALFSKLINSECKTNTCKYFNKTRIGCSLCGETWSDPSSLRTHLTKDHSNEVLTCCSINFDNINILHDHINTNHNKEDITNVSKKVKLNKSEKPVKTGAPKGYQGMLTNNYDYMITDLEENSWEQIDKFTELTTNWKIQKNIEYDINLNNINLFENIDNNIINNNETTNSTKNPFRVSNPLNKYFPFSNETEWYCFMMLKSYNYTKEQYNVMTKLLKIHNINPLTYDQIIYRIKDFKIQTPLQNDKESSFIYYGLVNYIRYMFADSFIAKQIHNSKKSNSSSFEFQPYASKRFQNLASKYNKNEIPIIIIPYLDKYKKHRTESDKTAGLYFFLLNFDKNFYKNNFILDIV